MLPKPARFQIRINICWPHTIFIVDDAAAEKEAMAGCIDRINAKNPRLKITVVLNLDCNFACPYCYEGENKGKFYMSDQTEAALICFIEKRLAPEKTALTVDFYGGEPLLSIPRICSISGKLGALAGGRGVTGGNS
ncbi:MAG: 4Fe-4S cluster-binding domain-containing protein [Desulfobacterales bacterium]|nr:4Fe-4S cluster-binding domain-containing protein [Desulfobacterales bacterium]MDD4072522.1 4Fe-4S cluster-binding domain-containing protein [Desulfobacterales bacterium]MDD4393701.1 4Fe-4S cluster-binding domain-containing protein [Desulfobacterales bacterium]